MLTKHDIRSWHDNPKNMSLYRDGILLYTNRAFSKIPATCRDPTHSTHTPPRRLLTFWFKIVGNVISNQNTNPVKLLYNCASSTIQKFSPEDVMSTSALSWRNNIFRSCVPSTWYHQMFPSPCVPVPFSCVPISVKPGLCQRATSYILCEGSHCGWSSTTIVVLLLVERTKTFVLRTRSYSALCNKMQFTLMWRHDCDSINLHGSILSHFMHDVNIT